MNWFPSLLGLKQDLFFDGVAAPGRVLQSMAVAFWVIMFFHLHLDFLCYLRLFCGLSIGLIPSEAPERRHGLIE